MRNTRPGTPTTVRPPLRETVRNLSNIGILAVMVGITGITGCATNPVTGKSELSLVSERW